MPRLKLMVLPSLAFVIAAACGGSASPSPAAPGNGSGTPTAAATPAASADSSADSSAAPDGAESRPPDDGSFDFGDAATKLSSLDSYRFTVEVTSTSTTAAGIEAGLTVFSGIVNQKEGAQTLEMFSKDESGEITDQTGLVLTSTGAWMRMGGDEPWLQLPTDQASAYAAAFGMFRPEQLFSLYFAAAATDNTLVGTEERNGIETDHYRGSDAIGAILAGLTGVTGSWRSDVWIAKDGGYLVHGEAAAAGGDATGNGSFSVVLDITDVNSPANKISPPE